MGAAIPSKLIDYPSSPWLGAVGNLWRRRGQRLGPGRARVDVAAEPDRADDWDKASDDGYNRARAWLSRETIGREGVQRARPPRPAARLCVAGDQTGNVFVEVLRDRAGREPVQLSHLLPQFVWYRARSGELELFQMDPYRGETAFVPFGARKVGQGDVREFLHQRTTNTVSSYYGLPAWLPARDSGRRQRAQALPPRFLQEPRRTPLPHLSPRTRPDGRPPSADRSTTLRQRRAFLSANAGDMAGRNLILQPRRHPRHRRTARRKLEDDLPEHRQAGQDDPPCDISLLNLGCPRAGTGPPPEQQPRTSWSDHAFRRAHRGHHQPRAARARTIRPGIQDYDFESRSTTPVRC